MSRSLRTGAVCDGLMEHEQKENFIGFLLECYQSGLCVDRHVEIGTTVSS